MKFKEEKYANLLITCKFRRNTAASDQKEIFDEQYKFGFMPVMKL